MEATSSPPDKKSLSDKDFDGLTLNLNPTCDDSNDTNQEGGEEEDPELIDY